MQENQCFYQIIRSHKKIKIEMQPNNFHIKFIFLNVTSKRIN